MNESSFIKYRQAQWKDLEVYLSAPQKVQADVLSNAYLELLDDLSYAKTFYPESPIVIYLNKLATNAHRKIYVNKREQRNRFVNFWKYEVPEALYNSRKELYISLFIFLCAILIGVFSTIKNPDFTIQILGYSYVNMTESNIEKGDPMGVYDGGSEIGMFFGLSTNNIRVSFLAFVLGIFGSIFTGLLLLYNGIMVGTFITFFWNKNLFALCITTIMLHGTLELWAIVVAGASGIILGNSLVFPGTYPRLYSLKKGAKKSLKIIIGLVPVFILAAIIEAGVTRHYLALGMFGRVLIIALSTLFIIWYFFIYPSMVNRQKYDEFKSTA